MFKLPQKTILGNLKIESVFQFYDVPRLFICSNASGAKFLVISTFDDYDFFEWLYLPLSMGRLSTILEKKISIKQAFLNCEDGYVYKIKSDFNGNADFSHLLPEQIEDEDLPEENVFIESKGHVKAFLGLGEVNAENAATSSKRETYNFHFYSDDAEAPEMDISNLGGVLSSFQDLANAIGQYCKGEVTPRGAIPADIIENSKFRATQIFDGSFGLQLKSKHMSDLFNSSLASDILLEFTNLIESKDDADILSNKLHILKVRVASKYRIFLKEVKRLDSPMKLDWGSPDRQRGRKIEISKTEIKNALELVSKIDVEMSESFTIKAELLGMDVETRKYRVRELSSGEIYKGSIDSESISKVDHSKISGIYKVLLKRIIETNYSSGSEYTKWLLIDLETTDPT